ncbi:MAG: type II toxin-antitoxin system VapC family toxin [Gemmataceae bacterium]
MILLDTDHLSVLWFARDRQNSNLGNRLVDSADKRIATTVVTLEETLRGWLAEINRLREFDKQITVYEKLVQAVERFGRWEIVAFDRPAVETLLTLVQLRVRIGVMDLKIASIALVHNALLLTANLKDFRRVPGLRVENWLE